MQFSVDTYYNGRLAVSCYTDDEPFGDVTINLPGYFLHSNDEAFINSINKDCGLTKSLIKNGIIKEIVLENVTYNMGRYDLATFNLSKLKEYDPDGVKKFLDKNNIDEEINIKI